MPSCSCDFDAEPGRYGWYWPDVENEDKELFRPLDTKRGRRCASCGVLMKPGKPCLEFSAFKTAEHDAEVNIYGEGGEVPRAPVRLCEKCGGRALSLYAAGYCNVDIFDVEQEMRDYWEMTGFTPEHERKAEGRAA